MEGLLVALDGTPHPPTRASVEQLLGGEEFFWLDLVGLNDEGTGLLEEVFKFHPLAVEDVQHFGQRPKLEEYDDFVYMVVYGMSGEGLIEVHCFYSERYLVTVHRQPCPNFAEVAERLGRRRAADKALVLHRVVDSLVDSFFPVLARLDDQIDELEDEILERPTDEQLGRIFDMKRSLIATRKVVTPERDMFAQLVSGAYDVPGMTPEAERYFRDIYDHLIRISDLVDSYRDLMSGATDAHMSTVSNRLNEVMKQLTIIATVFLPLSFLTGFFGQNFGWLVRQIGGFPVFMVFGLGLDVLAVVALLTLFKRRGWF